MPTVQQLIPNLLSGVSQQPATARDNSEGEEQINGLSDFAQGLSKRPASQHSAVLSATADAAYNSVHTHVVDRTATDRYRVILCNGDLKVFDAVTGVQQTVTFPDGKAYLNTADPSRDFRCVTIGDYTYITNGSVVVTRASTASAPAVYEAMVSVKRADYLTKFSVTIDAVTLTYTTPDGSAPATQKASLGTESIAANLQSLILNNAALSAYMSVAQYGSTLYIRRLDSGNFAISAGDGLGDGALIAIKGSTQRFDALPERVRNGVIIEIVGDPTNEFDNYFVKYDDQGTPSLPGVWRETVKPGILTNLDATTMPHQLVRGSVALQGLKVESLGLLPQITVLTTSTNIQFDMTAVFPQGTVTTLTVEATNYTHTSSADETGTQIATALIALVGGAYSASTVIIFGHTISADMAVWKAGPLAVVCVVTVALDNTVKFYNSSLALAVNALVGLLVKNTSDGSSGTVTANTATTITVAALTGGGTNKFLRGDLIDVVGTGTNYVFGNALWKPRKVGDMVTAPFPSIVGKKIRELFFWKNRLGMAAQGNVVLSQSGVPLNVFRQTATQILPDDMIDVASTLLADFHSAVHWNKTLVLWSSDSQTVLGGDPLTPETITLTQPTRFINSTRLRPLGLGRLLLFARGKGTSTQVHEYSIGDVTGTADAEDVTQKVPTYIPGTPIQMAGDSSLGFMALLTDADQSKLYVYRFHDVTQGFQQRSWSRWEFAPGTRIVSIDCIDGKLGMVVSRPLGVYLEIIDLDPSAV